MFPGNVCLVFRPRSIGVGDPALDRVCPNVAQGLTQVLIGAGLNELEVEFLAEAELLLGVVVFDCLEFVS